MKHKNILVPLISPLTHEYNICESSVKRIIEDYSKFATGLIPCLTSGEGWCLNENQWTDMVRFCIKYANDIDIIVGIERATTNEVLHYVEIAQLLGANGVMITTPFGINVSQHEMIEHYKSVHDKSNCDIWIYHEQSLSKNMLNLNGLFVISNFERVVGIKDSSESRMVLDNITKFNNCGVSVYHGLEKYLANADDVAGNIVSLSNLEPELCVKASNSIADEKLQRHIKFICDGYSLTSDDWYRHVKFELYNRGVISTDNIVNKITSFG